MSIINDKTGDFTDFNFKLIVVDALLDKNPVFEQELQNLKEKYTNDYWNWSEEEFEEKEGLIPEMFEYFANLKLEQNDLAKITALCFDGGNEIYFYLCPDWDGENDLFDVTSVDGFEKLPNLNEVEYISMANEDVLEPFRQKGISIL